MKVVQSDPQKMILRDSPWIIIFVCGLFCLFLVPITWKAIATESDKILPLVGILIFIIFFIVFLFKRTIVTFDKVLGSGEIVVENIFAQRKLISRFKLSELRGIRLQRVSLGNSYGIQYVLVGYNRSEQNLKSNVQTSGFREGLKARLLCEEIAKFLNIEFIDNEFFGN